MKHIVIAAIALALGVTGHAQNHAAADREAVRAAALDYIEALYQAQPERIARSVHRDLAKVGYFRRGGEAAITVAPMTYQQLYDLASTWNKDGKRAVASAPKDVVIYDISTRTASVKVTAMWGIDYMHLAKSGPDDTWKIVNVLWQEHAK